MPAPAIVKQSDKALAGSVGFWKRSHSPRPRLPPPTLRAELRALQALGLKQGPPVFHGHGEGDGEGPFAGNQDGPNGTDMRQVVGVRL